MSPSFYQVFDFQVKSGTIFDNFLLTDDPELASDEAATILDTTCAGEKKMKDQLDEEERKKQEEEDAKYHDEEDEDEEEIEEDEVLFIIQSSIKWKISLKIRQMVSRMHMTTSYVIIIIISLS